MLDFNFFIFNQHRNYLVSSRRCAISIVLPVWEGILSTFVIVNLHLSIKQNNANNAIYTYGTIKLEIKLHILVITCTR